MRRNFSKNTAAVVLLGFSLAACDHLPPPGDRSSTGSQAATEGAGGGPETTYTPETWPTPDTPPPADGVLCEAETYSDKYSPGYTQDPAILEEVQDIIGSMTIDQKVLQLTGIGAPNYDDGNRWEDIQRSRDDEVAGILGHQWRDGPHGLNLESGLGRRDWLNYATSFPTSVAQGATFDLDVVYRMGEASGDETVAAGNTVLLGPCMNILRHPFWGRAQETFGEDSYHLGRIASAYTAGLQQFISGCAKHYAANNIEINRFNLNAAMDEQTLREVYARHFEMVVTDGGVGCIMAAYNAVNGKKSTQNKHLLTEILRDDFGFKGFVLTDWWAMPGANNGQGPVNPPDDKINAAEALAAGLDVEVPWAINYDAIPSIVSDGTIDVSLVNRAVGRVLEQKLRFNTMWLGEPVGLKTPITQEVDHAIVGNEEHVAIAQEMAEKSMVLLKNDGDTLPIPASATKVAVVGAQVEYTVRSDNPPTKIFDFARDAALGDRGSSRVRPRPEMTLGPLDGITAAAPAGVEVVGGNDASVAEDADFVVVVVGLTAGDEGEEYTGAGDRESLALGEAQDALVQSVVALGKPMVVVIEAGAVVSMPWLDQVQAVVMAWYPGMVGGAAMGRLLFGDTNFSGRLPVTWPKDIGQFPTFNEGPTTNMDYYIGYRRFDVTGETPLFAFGHGLSYTTFDYTRVEAPCQVYPKDGVIQLEVDITNSGAVAGDEVIQVYASYPETRAERRSVKELKAFYRVSLEAEEAKTVTIPIRVNDLKFWAGGSKGFWLVESGPVLLQVGPSSDQLLQSVQVHIQ